MDQFLERPRQWKLIQEEIDNPYSPVSIKETEFLLQSLPTKKTSYSDDITSEFCQIFKKEN